MEGKTVLILRYHFLDHVGTNVETCRCRHTTTQTFGTVRVCVYAYACARICVCVRA